MSALKTCSISSQSNVLKFCAVVSRFLLAGLMSSGWGFADEGKLDAADSLQARIRSAKSIKESMKVISEVALNKGLLKEVLIIKQLKS